MLSHPLPVGTASLVDECPCNECRTYDDLGRLQTEVQQIPCAPGLIKKMRDEFRELKQGRMSVVEYRDKFLTLVKTQPYGWKEAESSQREPQEKNDEPEWTSPYKKHRNNSSGGFASRYNKPPAQNYRPNHNNNGGPPKPGGNHNHHSNNNNNHPNHNNNHPNNNNTTPNGSNAIPVTPKDKSTVNCYECGVVGHYSNECPKKLARIPPTTAAPLQQRRFARKNPEQ
ncbi:hypothetical protein QYE76_034650 [Lolium multiflorum]|uniref:CCHC-type domain-containing protein n=1 Tax=Lolium multiflorum TaxID=4521 RepID=A0AAD8QZJ1_LOLMU|nr:hypothetical protein QYE76_034650 [Lolium multiflorum]